MCQKKKLSGHILLQIRSSFTRSKLVKKNIIGRALGTKAHLYQSILLYFRLYQLQQHKMEQEREMRKGLQISLTAIVS